MKYFFMLFLPLLCFGEIKILNPLPFKMGERFSFRILILGQYVGIFNMQLERTTNINEKLYPVTSSQLFTKPDLRHLYDMYDSDWTVFDENVLPLYHERYIKEGKWEDHLYMTFFHEVKNASYFSKKRNYNELKFTGNFPIRDYNTLLLFFRALDYNSISQKEKINVSYRHREQIYNSCFTYERVTVTYKKKKVKAIRVKEEGGLGVIFTMLDDENRMPFEIRIGAFYIVGFRFVDLYVVIDDFSPGTEIVNFKNNFDFSN